MALALTALKIMKFAPLCANEVAKKKEKNMTNGLLRNEP